jgi:hypothetical protein
MVAGIAALTLLLGLTGVALTATPAAAAKKPVVKTPAGTVAKHVKKPKKQKKTHVPLNGVALNNGDVLAATGDGQVEHFSPSGTLLDTLDNGSGSTFTTGMCFDSSQDLYVTNFSSNTISEFNSAGNLVAETWASVPTTPESCSFNAAGDMYVGGPGAPTIYEFNPSGTLINSYSVTGGSGTGGTDWLDVSSDQCTILYTGEGSEILSYNVCTQTQNADFADSLPAPCFELRFQPNGDVLLACGTEVIRFNGAGTVLQTYTIPSTGELFSMNLDPDGTTFWTGDDTDGEIYHVDISSGDVLSQFASNPSEGLFGLSIVGGIVVSQPTITLAPPTGTSNVGTPYTVTATITNPGGSLSGQTVDFSVSGSNATSGTGTTNGSGQATFTYTGTNTGPDTITASFTNSANTTVSDNATVNWVSTGPAPTQTSTSLSGGGKSGASISVPTNTAVTDQATLSGANAATAGGTVTYKVYSDAACSVSAGSGGTVNVTGGVVPGSSSVSLPTAGTYYWQASYSGDTNNAASKNTCGSEVETVTHPVTSPPTCVLSAVIAGPPKQIQVSVQAAAGLESVSVTEDVNNTVNVPTFTPGDTSPLVVTGTKINQSLVSELALTVTDVNGVSTSCDPADFSLTGGPPQSASNLTAGEHFVTITNDGLSRVVITVNGRRRVVKLDSADGLAVVNLQRLFKLTNNVVTVEGIGTGSADVLFAD